MRVGEELDDDLTARLAALTQAQQSFVLGMIGASLLRDWHQGGAGQADRMAELFAAVRALDGQRREHAVPIEVGAREGYADWASTYDEPNAMIEAEESLTHSLLAPRLHPGAVVLDAACGTGRHLAWLTRLGCHSIGVDLTEAMLQRARVAAPGAGLVQGDLRAVPLGSESVDAAICSLALCHLPELLPALRELARVVRPGGALVVSDPHGRSAFAGGQGFIGNGGVTRSRYIRNHHRQAHEWIEAFHESGFAIDSCHEPEVSESAARRHPVAQFFPDAVLTALRGVPHLWVWSAIRGND